VGHLSAANIPLGYRKERVKFERSTTEQGQALWLWIIGVYYHAHPVVIVAEPVVMGVVPIVMAVIVMCRHGG
jgi:hypothetical protein